MKINPTHAYVLVETLAMKRVTAAGIHLPESMKHQRLTYGRVEALGPGVFSREQGTYSPIPLQIGDIVLIDAAHGCIPLEFARNPGDDGAYAKRMLIGFEGIAGTVEATAEEQAKLFEPDKPAFKLSGKEPLITSGRN